MYEVLWEDSATNELAALWLSAPSEERAKITAATAEIDRSLQLNPTDSGESRPDGIRIHYVLPLGIRFDVDANRGVARVLQVWRVRRRAG